MISYHNWTSNSKLSVDESLTKLLSLSNGSKPRKTRLEFELFILFMILFCIDQ